MNSIFEKKIKIASLNTTENFNKKHSNTLIRNDSSNSPIIKNDDPLNLSAIRNKFSDEQLRNGIAFEIFAKRCQTAAKLIKTNPK